MTPLPSLSFSTDISCLGLPRVVEKRLRNNGIHTVQCLCILTWEDFYDMPNVGAVSIRAVESALRERGLRLAPRKMNRDFASACQLFVDALGKLGPVLSAADDLLRRIEQRRFLLEYETLSPIYEAAMTLQKAIVLEEVARERLANADIASAGRRSDEWRRFHRVPAARAAGDDEDASEDAAGAGGSEDGLGHLPPRVRRQLAELPESTRKLVAEKFFPVPRPFEPWLQYLGVVDALARREPEGNPGSSPGSPPPDHADSEPEP